MLWTIGVFALNFGPVLVGPVLDLVGPKLTSILGALWASLQQAQEHHGPSACRLLLLCSAR